jgi:hypothetical protein
MVARDYRPRHPLDRTVRAERRSRHSSAPAPAGPAERRSDAETLHGRVVSGHERTSVACPEVAPTFWQHHSQLSLPGRQIAGTRETTLAPA